MIYLYGKIISKVKEINQSPVILNLKKRKYYWWNIKSLINKELLLQ